jgi:hypothetical protein
MSALPAVRELEDDLEEIGVETVLVDIHSEEGAKAAENFDFEYTPTYLLFDGSGQELLRTNSRPSLDEIRRTVASG